MRSTRETTKGIVRLVLPVFFFSLFNNILMVKDADAAVYGLPEPAQMLNSVGHYSYPMLLGMRLDPQNPMKMEFIVDAADAGSVYKDEAQKIISYFFAGLTMPNDSLWVNLSPYENDRIMDEQLAQTSLGKDLLAQDYILKQLSSSLTHPESETGKAYWEKINSGQGSDAFNKIWISPDQVEVHEENNVVMITKSTLKAELEGDYQAAASNGGSSGQSSVSSSLKSTVLPSVIDELQNGAHFAPMRQIYNSLILSMWFKKKFRDSFYRAYFNQAKTSGIKLADKEIKERVFNLYVEAFQKGVYSYVKKEYDRNSRRRTKKRYFSGGVSLTSSALDNVIVTKTGLSGIVASIIPTKTANIIKIDMKAQSQEVFLAQEQGIEPRLAAEFIAERDKLRQFEKDELVGKVNAFMLDANKDLLEFGKEQSLYYDVDGYLVKIGDRYIADEALAENFRDGDGVLTEVKMIKTGKFHSFKATDKMTVQVERTNRALMLELNKKIFASSALTLENARDTLYAYLVGEGVVLDFMEHTSYYLNKNYSNWDNIQKYVTNPEFSLEDLESSLKEKAVTVIENHKYKYNMVPLTQQEKTALLKTAQNLVADENFQEFMVEQLLYSNDIDLKHLSKIDGFFDSARAGINYQKHLEEYLWSIGKKGDDLTFIVSSFKDMVSRFDAIFKATVEAERKFLLLKNMDAKQANRVLKQMEVSSAVSFMEQRREILTEVDKALEEHIFIDGESLDPSSLGRFELQELAAIFNDYIAGKLEFEDLKKLFGDAANLALMNWGVELELRLEEDDLAQITTEILGEQELIDTFLENRYQEYLVPYISVKNDLKEMYELIKGELDYLIGNHAEYLTQPYEFMRSLQGDLTVDEVLQDMGFDNADPVLKEELVDLKKELEELVEGGLRPLKQIADEFGDFNLEMLHGIYSPDLMDEKKLAKYGQLLSTNAVNLASNIEELKGSSSAINLDKVRLDQFVKGYSDFSNQDIATQAKLKSAFRDLVNEDLEQDSRTAEVKDLEAQEFKKYYTHMHMTADPLSQAELNIANAYKGQAKKGLADGSLDKKTAVKLLEIEGRTEEQAKKIVEELEVYAYIEYQESDEFVPEGSGFGNPVPNSEDGYGGVNLKEIEVKADASSALIEFAPFDINNFSGFSFNISSIEKANVAKVLAMI